jgi:hypothetical protein
MVFTIGGVDITPYIAKGGIKWSRNDVDGANAGRMQNGEMMRDRIATKYRWDITCRPLTAEEQSIVLQAIQPEYISVTATDPLTNTTKTAQCYSNNFPSTYLIRKEDGTEYWTGLAFPVIEV